MFVLFKITLAKKASWKMIGTTGVCVTSDGFIVRRDHEDDGKILVTNRSGLPVDTYPDICKCIAKFCNSFTLCEFECHSSRKLMAHHCFDCGIFVVIDRTNHSVMKAFSLEPGIYDAMCAGPKGTVFLGSSTTDELLQLQFDESTNRFREIRRVKHPCTDVLHMVYKEQIDLLILSSWISGKVTAIRLDPVVNIIWQLTGTVEGKKFGARGICSDDTGRLFLADLNSRIIVLNAASGTPLQVLLEGQGLGPMLNVLWLGSPNQLFVKHTRGDGASIYDII